MLSRNTRERAISLRNLRDVVNYRILFCFFNSLDFRVMNCRVMAVSAFTAEYGLSDGILSGVPIRGKILAFLNCYPFKMPFIGF